MAVCQVEFKDAGETGERECIGIEAGNDSKNTRFSILWAR